MSELLNARLNHSQVKVSHDRSVVWFKSVVKLLLDLTRDRVVAVDEVHAHVEVEIAAFLGPGVNLERTHFSFAFVAALYDHQKLRITLMNVDKVRVLVHVVDNVFVFLLVILV